MECRQRVPVALMHLFIRFLVMRSYPFDLSLRVVEKLRAIGSSCRQASSPHRSEKSRTVRPQLSNAQCKALAAGAPKTVKAIVHGKSLAELEQQVDRDVKRLGIQPQLGRNTAEDPGDQGWTTVTRKQKKSAPSKEETVIKQVFALQPDQFACNGRALPTRQTLTSAAPAVSVVDDEAELLRLVKAIPADCSTPLVAITSMRYKLEDKWEKKLKHKPEVCSLRFSITDQTGSSFVGHHHANCVDSKATARERTVDTTTTATCSDYKALIRELAPEAKEDIKELWIPKSLHAGSALIKCQAPRAPFVLEKLTEAGFSVVPYTECQRATRVAWLREVHSWEQASETAQQLLEAAPSQSPLPDCQVMWTQNSALFAKEYKGGVAWGLRLPLQQADAIAAHTGRDIRKIFKLHGAPRVWMKEDLTAFFLQLKWTADPIFAHRGVWTVRASLPPPRKVVTVRSGYEQATIRVEEESPKP
eukprot:4084381-Amphidinium_carterae.1